MLLQTKGGISRPEQHWSASRALAPRAIQDAAVSTAKIIISAEERLAQRVRSVLRVTVATIFLGISGLISLGANVTTAFAKKVSSERGSRASGHVKTHGKRATYLKAVHRRHSAGHHQSKHRHRTLTAHHSSSAMRGMASWYGKQFHNRRTASGVRFNTHAMMAAHRTLPFGTRVRVTNLANHKTCVVEITDRGPYAKGRIIDLSLAAAEELGMAESGVAEVQLEILGSAGPGVFEDLASEKNAPVFDHISRPAPSDVPVLAGETATP